MALLTIGVLSFFKDTDVTKTLSTIREEYVVYQQIKQQKMFISMLTVTRLSTATTLYNEDMFENHKFVLDYYRNIVAL